MRSVCGCISASSAATEIMKTPRSSSSSRLRADDEGCPLLRGPRPAIVIPFPLCAGPSRRTEQRGAGVLPVEGLPEPLDRLTLLLREVLRDVDLDPVVDVA